MEYKMGLQQKYFYNMKQGSKRIELRINDDKRKLLKVGDIIYFLLEPDRKNSLKAKIVSLSKYKNFNEAVDNIPIEYLSSSTDTKEEYLNDLNKYYSQQEQDEYGVLAIEIQVLEKSCGLIIFKKELDKSKVLMVHQVEGHWSLPKGHVEAGETEKETAIRETLEETGVKARVIGDFREVITYYVKDNILKDVVYFIGEIESGDIVPQFSEVTEVDFVEVNEVIKLIEHEDVKKILEKAISYYQNNLEA